MLTGFSPSLFVIRLAASVKLAARAASAYVRLSRLRSKGGARTQLELKRVSGALIVAASLLCGTPTRTAYAASLPVFFSTNANPFGLIDIGDGSAPVFVDIDKDGDLDIFSGEKFGNFVFFRNTGNATSPAFSSPILNPFGLTQVGSYSTPTFTDIDGDGDLDLFAGQGLGNLVFYKNTGSITTPAFATGIFDPFGISNPGHFSAPCFADIDTDGDLDLFAGNDQGEIIFFRNSGSATSPAFRGENPNTFGLTDVGAFSAPAFWDADFDGDLDALAGEVGGNFVFFKNTGTSLKPAFASSSVNAFGLGRIGQFSLPAFADIDGDGDFDLFAGNENGDFAFFQNSSSPSSIRFQPDSLYPLDYFPNQDATPFVVDMDGDGDMDVICGSTSGDFIYFENLGSSSSPKMGAPVFNPFGLRRLEIITSPTFVDIDADGDLDAFAGNYYGGVFAALNTGSAASPQFGAFTIGAFGIPVVGANTRPAFADIDNDGDYDLFVGSSSGDVIYLQNTGSRSLPAFAAAKTNPFGIVKSGGLVAPSFGDIDGDGDFDLLIGLFDGNMIFARNTGTLSTPFFDRGLVNPFGLPDMGDVASPAFGDMDGDGDEDVLLGSFNNGIRFFRNISEKSMDFLVQLENSNPFGLTRVNNNSSPVFADIDADGDLDAFTGNAIAYITFFRNTGNAIQPAFAPGISNAFGIKRLDMESAPVFIDIDGDGDLDLFSGEHYGGIVLFSNTGSTISPAFSQPVGNPFGLTGVGYLSKPSFTDIDGDGDFDAIVGNASGNFIFFRNTGTAASPAFSTSNINPFGLIKVASDSSPTFADVDKDGDPDLLTGTTFGDLVFYRNIGSASHPSFGVPLFNSFGYRDVGAFVRPVFADIDHDADFDLFTGEQRGDYYFYRYLFEVRSKAFLTAIAK